MIYTKLDRKWNVRVRTSRMEYGSGMEAAAAAAIEAAENLCMSEILAPILQIFHSLNVCMLLKRTQLLPRRRQIEAYGTMLAFSLNL